MESDTETSVETAREDAEEERVEAFIANFELVVCALLSGESPSPPTIYNAIRLLPPSFARGFLSALQFLMVASNNVRRSAVLCHLHRALSDIIAASSLGPQRDQDVVVGTRAGVLFAAPIAVTVRDAGAGTLLQLAPVLDASPL
ncbi:hypothetical protein BWQ96_10179 [Gracilariopsis chorda]|uniref:Uncharacterized protein n=1 Tax=Gracilariopsis chorda TaxID=448386 RepID=A0A2V3IDK5_9FLOR|nr:hypothetical protein BWQ96_10179 [Gracilariopsis chorda]|eukprot:PXF40118.1 hypothetical protein BWQ96_10179 [Gracilariopsis chorda]